MESNALDLILRFLWLPLMGYLGFVSKKFFDNMEKKTDTLSKNQEDTKESLVKLEMELNKNYYDKQEIKDHIVNPIMDKFTEVDQQVKVMSGMMNDIHSDMAILKYKILGEELDANRRNKN